MAERTAASSSRTPDAKDARSLPAASSSHAARPSVLLAATLASTLAATLAATLVLRRSRRLRAATIRGEVVSTATLTRRASANLQSRPFVSRRAMVRPGGTGRTVADRSEDGAAARHLRVAHSFTTRWLPQAWAYALCNAA